MAVKPPRAARPGSASTSSLSQADTTQQTPMSIQTAGRTPSPHRQDRVPSPGSVSSSAAAIPAPEFPPHLNATQMDNMLFRVAFDAVSHPAMHSPDSALKKGGRNSYNDRHAHSNTRTRQRNLKYPSQDIPNRPDSPCELCDGLQTRVSAPKMTVTSPEPWQAPAKDDASAGMHDLLSIQERSQSVQHNRSGPSTQLSRRSSGPDYSRRSKSSGGEMQRVNLFDDESSSNTENNADENNGRGSSRDPQERRGFRWAWANAGEQRSKSPAVSTPASLVAFASDFEPSSKPQRGRSQEHSEFSHRSPKPLSQHQQDSKPSRSHRDAELVGRVHVARPVSVERLRLDKLDPERLDKLNSVKSQPSLQPAPPAPPTRSSSLNVALRQRTESPVEPLSSSSTSPSMLSGGGSSAWTPRASPPHSTRTRALRDVRVSSHLRSSPELHRDGDPGRDVVGRGQGRWQLEPEEQEQDQDHPEIYDYEHDEDAGHYEDGDDDEADDDRRIRVRVGPAVPVYEPDSEPEPDSEWIHEPEVVHTEHTHATPAAPNWPSTCLLSLSPSRHSHSRSPPVPPPPKLPPAYQTPSPRVEPVEFHLAEQRLLVLERELAKATQELSFAAAEIDHLVTQNRELELTLAKTSQGLREAEAERAAQRESMRTVEEEVRGIRGARNLADEEVRRLEVRQRELRSETEELQSVLRAREAEHEHDREGRDRVIHKAAARLTEVQKLRGHAEEKMEALIGRSHALNHDLQDKKLLLAAAQARQEVLQSRVRSLELERESLTDRLESSEKRAAEAQRQARVLEEAKGEREAERAALEQRCEQLVWERDSVRQTLEALTPKVSELERELVGKEVMLRDMHAKLKRSLHNQRLIFHEQQNREREWQCLLISTCSALFLPPGDTPPGPLPHRFSPPHASFAIPHHRAPPEPAALPPSIPRSPQSPRPERDRRTSLTAELGFLKVVPTTGETAFNAVDIETQGRGSGAAARDAEASQAGREQRRHDTGGGVDGEEKGEARRRSGERGRGAQSEEEMEKERRAAARRKDFVRRETPPERQRLGPHHAPDAGAAEGAAVTTATGQTPSPAQLRPEPSLLESPSPSPSHSRPTTTPTRSRSTTRTRLQPSSTTQQASTTRSSQSSASRQHDATTQRSLTKDMEIQTEGQNEPVTPTKISQSPPKRMFDGTITADGQFSPRHSRVEHSPLSAEPSPRATPRQQHALPTHTSSVTVSVERGTAKHSQPHPEAASLTPPPPARRQLDVDSTASPALASVAKTGRESRASSEEETQTESRSPFYDVAEMLLEQEKFLKAEIDRVLDQRPSAPGLASEQHSPTMLFDKLHPTDHHHWQGEMTSAHRDSGAIIPVSPRPHSHPTPDPSLLDRRASDGAASGRDSHSSVDLKPPQNRSDAAAARASGLKRFPDAHRQPRPISPPPDQPTYPAPRLRPMSPTVSPQASHPSHQPPTSSQLPPPPPPRSQPSSTADPNRTSHPRHPSVHSRAGNADGQAVDSGSESEFQADANGDVWLTPQPQSPPVSTSPSHYTHNASAPSIHPQPTPPIRVMDRRPRDDISPSPELASEGAPVSAAAASPFSPPQPPANAFSLSVQTRSLPGPLAAGPDARSMKGEHSLYDTFLPPPPNSDVHSAAPWQHADTDAAHAKRVHFLPSPRPPAAAQAPSRSLSPAPHFTLAGRDRDRHSQRIEEIEEQLRALDRSLPRTPAEGAEGEAPAVRSARVSREMEAAQLQRHADERRRRTEELKVLKDLQRRGFAGYSPGPRARPRPGSGSEDSASLSPDTMSPSSPRPPASSPRRLPLSPPTITTASAPTTLPQTAHPLPPHAHSQSQPRAPPSPPLPSTLIAQPGPLPAWAASLSGALAGAGSEASPPSPPSPSHSSSLPPALPPPHTLTPNHLSHHPASRPPLPRPAAPHSAYRVLSPTELSDVLSSSTPLPKHVPAPAPAPAPGLSFSMPSPSHAPATAPPSAPARDSSPGWAVRSQGKSGESTPALEQPVGGGGGGGSGEGGVGKGKGGGGGGADPDLEAWFRSIEGAEAEGKPLHIAPEALHHPSSSSHHPAAATAKKPPIFRPPTLAPSKPPPSSSISAGASSPRVLVSQPLPTRSDIPPRRTSFAGAAPTLPPPSQAQVSGPRPGAHPPSSDNQYLTGHTPTQPQPFHVEAELELEPPAGVPGPGPLHAPPHRDASAAGHGEIAAAAPHWQSASLHLAPPPSQPPQVPPFVSATHLLRQARQHLDHAQAGNPLLTSSSGWTHTGTSRSTSPIPLASQFSGASPAHFGPTGSLRPGPAAAFQRRSQSPTPSFGSVSVASGSQASGLQFYYPPLPGSQSPDSPPLSVRLEHRVREIRSKYDAVYGYQTAENLEMEASEHQSRTMKHQHELALMEAQHMAQLNRIEHASASNIRDVYGSGRSRR